MRLEIPEKKHEQEYLEMIKEFTDNKEIIIPGSANLKEWENYQDFLTRIKRNRETGNPKHDNAISYIYFLINDEEQVVGAVRIDPVLSEALRYDGGNIGYGIRPSQRRRWYATIWLKLALEKSKERWLDKVMLTCNKENIWSSKAIKNNGWIRDSEYEHEWKAKDRYWILTI